MLSLRTSDPSILIEDDGNPNEENPGNEAIMTVEHQKRSKTPINAIPCNSNANNAKAWINNPGHHPLLS